MIFQTPHLLILVCPCKFNSSVHIALMMFNSWKNQGSSVLMLLTHFEGLLIYYIVAFGEPFLCSPHLFFLSIPSLLLPSGLTSRSVFSGAKVLLFFWLNFFLVLCNNLFTLTYPVFYFPHIFVYKHNQMQFLYLFSLVLCTIQ